jgi:hypothetical protein
VSRRWKAAKGFEGGKQKGSLILLWEPTLKRILRAVLIDAHRNLRFLTRAQAAPALAVLLSVLTVALNGSSPQLDPGAQAAAKSMEAKLDILGSTEPTTSYQAVVVTELEANSYFKGHAAELFPKGVRSLALHVQPDRLTAAGDIDFDELSRSYPNPNDMAPKVLAAMFHGTERATITGNIHSEDTGYRVQIDSVVVGSMTVPHWLVDYVVQNVLQPNYKFDLSKPVPYPDHVRKIVQGSGQMTFLRGPKAGK